MIKTTLAIVVALLATACLPLGPSRTFDRASKTAPAYQSRAIVRDNGPLVAHNK